MKSSGRNIELASFDSIFSTEETRQGGNQRIEQLPLSDLVPFKDHPFRVVDDDRMMETVESVKESERGIVDMETLRHTNEALISTLDEVMAIQEDGRTKRLAAEQELADIENQLRDKMLQMAKK